MKRGKPAKENRFTVSEVGTLLEAMDKKVDQIAEGHSGLDRRLEKLEVAVHGNSRRLDHLELGVNVLNGKASRLEDAVSLLSKDLRETRQELGETRGSLEAKIDGLGERLSAVESNR